MKDEIIFESDFDQLPKIPVQLPLNYFLTTHHYDKLNVYCAKTKPSFKKRVSFLASHLSISLGADASLVQAHRGKNKG
ncbi:hypothetical protein A0J61_06206 [Choanephora cucurbitarum]|uniref:Uncharacterized protein n=1 Tax=Choanephora cucurbitarum TaxID=101091 RepID=A0A1C7N9H7_9FUNG|nr:hypothetical protein A0J61_06206 [Choanephora cucurbitarum]